ncbi:GntR family transcriptional regulator [Neorhizobium sp. AL 9.2.2]|uniref:GntR family transcriptional regulator n=1 Tax=Neorhizobium sp. AL 9.2.2 TaxID=2712894 RepID=UPI001574280F|nr:GntR family transcriptional regulator [Neorhizobium sp. AL 9.2.2]NSY18447.1 GntR family transcriptional regulator [Neorhizobium sp. AL 9.2.2]
MADSPLVRSAGEIPTPLYHQVHLVLRERIEQGYYGPNGMLPAEMELAREFDVSRITVARAINELAQQGFVERRRGAGTRIVTRDLPPPVPANIDGLLENLADMGNRTKAKVLEFGFVLPPLEARQELQVGPNELVQRAVRVRSHNGEPFSYLTSFVPGYIGQHLSEEDMNAGSLMSLFERHGIKIGSARQSFSAALADPKIGQALAVPVGTPLLAITRTVLDIEERGVEYIRILYRTDRYQYRMTMERDKQGSSRFKTAAGTQIKNGG